jgi:O-methyltransferase/aklanonic acid methyltransferase
MMTESDQPSAFKREVAESFDRAAPSYGQVGTDFFTYFARQLVDRLNVPAGAHVLDVAAGRGALLFAAGDKVGASGRIIGVDISEEMVHLTRAEIERRNLENTEMQYGDAESLEFPDDSFDFILCGFAFFFFIPHMEATLKEFRRILKMNGKIGIITPTGYDPNWRWLGELIRTYFPHDFKPPLAWIAPAYTDTPEKMSQILTDGGFSDVQTDESQLDLVYSDEDAWWAGQLSNASRMTYDAMPSETLAAFKKTAFERLSQVKQADGFHQSYSALLTIASSSG